MFKIKKKKLEKLAGTNVPKDKKQWPAEVLKALVSQHPYIDTSQVKINFTRLEPDSETAAGKVVIQNAAAIPFSIRSKKNGKKMELDPLDILFDGERFVYLNENSLRQAIDKQQVGRLVKKDDKVPPGNRYVGDLTGDVTPLEWSAYPSGFAGPHVGATAGSGLLSYVIKNREDVTKLFNLLNTYDGINSAMETLGLRDSLENLRSGMSEDTHVRQLAHVMRRPGGGFAVAFNNGDTRGVRAKELKVALGSDFQPVMRQVMQRGWCMIRDFPTMRSVDSKPLAVLPAPIEAGGRYRVMTLDGKKKTAIVCDQMVDFDGQVLKNQKAICEDDGYYAEGKAFQGWSLPGRVPNDFGEHKYQGKVLKVPDKTLGPDVLKFPIGVIDTGVTGCFVDESWGSPKATPSFTVEKIISMPDDPNVIIGRRADTKSEVGLVVVDGLVRPQTISPGHYDKNLMPDHSYYIPAHMVFVETPKKVALADKQALVESRPEAVLKKNANRYHIHGRTEDGPIDYDLLTAENVRTKLAWYGAGDDVIEDVMDMNEGQTKSLYGLKEINEIDNEIKTAALDVPSEIIENIKTAAQDAIEGMEQADDEAKDPRNLDAILSLQFVSDESLENLVDSTEIFEECEDRLARLLLAARQGEKSINEKSVQKALKGIGEARKNLKVLKLELESREDE